MHKMLLKILEKTKKDLSLKKKKSQVFLHAMKKPHYGKISIIAEIKFASPTEEKLGSKKMLIKRVKDYEDAGADAISVVTEKHFFKGDPTFVRKIKLATKLPILQKDFIVDEYQIYEAVKNGADAILFIAKLLSKKELAFFVDRAKRLGLEPVVEINNNSDLEKVKDLQISIIAVNARDLATFEVNVDKACRLLKKVPKKFVKLGFSGIKSSREVQKYKNAGAAGVLVGTSLMKAKNIQEFMKGLRI